MKTELGSRLQDLALRALRTGAPLAPADVQRIATETGASEKEIRTGFLQALRALEAGIAANEKAGHHTSRLRDGIGDGVGTKFLNQRVASAETTPALMGKNLTAPGDDKVTTSKAEAGRAALPVFKTGAHTLADCSLVLRGEKVLVDAPRNEDTLLAQGFSKEPGTELLHPPIDEKGWYQPGTYQLPGNAKLVVGTENNVKLDVRRVADAEFDRLMELLPKQGFDLNYLTGLMSLPRV